MSDWTHDPIRRDGTSTHAVVVLGRDLTSVRRSRQWLREVLEGLIDEAQLDDGCLIVSELVTNALRHGLGEVVVQTALDDDGTVRLSVTDWSDGVPAVLEPDPERLGGLGLRIVERLTSAWGVASFPGGKTVWAALAEPAPVGVDAGPVPPHADR